MRLVVTTWNLQGRVGLDTDAVAAHLHEQGSDVVLLQEVQRRQVRQVARSLSARSLAWRFKHWTPSPSTRPEGMAVLGVTRPLERATARALTARWRPWSWRRRIVQFAAVDGLGLANVHLTPHGEHGTRAQEVARIVHRFAATGATTRAIAGDFNALPDSGVVDELVLDGFRDAWLTADTGNAGGGATNWSSSRRTGPPNQRIDYLWVTDDVLVRGARVPDHDDPGFELFPRLSDHLPLTVELEI